MSIQLINTSVLTEDWRVIGATTTKTVLVQSKSDENITNCRFSLRLRYGVEGLETPIYSQEINTYLEPNQARLIDFRELIPDDLRDGNLINSWQIESQISFNFAPITVRYYEIDLKDAEKAFYQGQLAGKADIGHGHELADIALLETALLQKLSAPVSPPLAGQILRAIGPDAWEWSTVQFGEGGAIALPSQIVNTVNGQTGDVTIALPGLATATTNGLLSSANFSILTGQNAANGNVLQIVNNAPAWSPLVIPASVEIWTALNANSALEVNKKYLITGGTTFTLPNAASGFIEIVNNQSVSITLNAGGSTTIGGLSVIDKATVFSSQTSAIVPAATEARLVSSNSSWISFNCSPTKLLFTYGGTALALNSNNPSSAFDLIHYLGGVSSFVNPATNGVITAATNSNANATGGVNVLTDRVATPSVATQNWQPNNVANSWVAWQFPKGFKPTGMLIQSNGYTNAYHLRSFELRYSNDVATALSSSTSVGSWIQGQSWTNQTQITGLYQWFSFSITGMPEARRWAIRATGLDSSGSNFPTISEVCWFGEYTL